MSELDTALAPVNDIRPGAVPGWVDTLFYGLAIYIALGAAAMLTGLGGPTITHYVGLLADTPANVANLVIAAAAAHHTRRGKQRTAWVWVSIALGLYCIGSIIAQASWLHGRDPFPGPADIFFTAFYPALLLASLYMIRAAAVRVPWVQLFLDATIFVVGFGAFFWFLVIRPAASDTEVDFLKHALSQAYAAMDCLLLLMLGVLLMTGARSPGGRRVPLLLVSGFTTMFLGDILWSLAKVGGYYLPGGIQDVLYLACYLPLAAAGREQMREIAPAVSASTTSITLARSLPYAAMLAAFLLLVYFTRGDIGGPATVMTMIVFTLTLLLMARQSVVLRGDALTRERHAARMVEDRYASLIANASDVIMIAAADGTLRFASPASEYTFGLKPEDAAGKNLHRFVGRRGRRAPEIIPCGSRRYASRHRWTGAAAHRKQHRIVRTGDRRPKFDQ